MSDEEIEASGVFVADGIPDRIAAIDEDAVAAEHHLRSVPFGMLSLRFPIGVVEPGLVLAESSVAEKVLKGRCVEIVGAMERIQNPARPFPISRDEPEKGRRLERIAVVEDRPPERAAEGPHFMSVLIALVGRDDPVGYGCL